MSEDPREQALLETAGEWLAMRQDASWSAAHEARFQAWLHAAPAHAQAYERMNQTWRQLGQTEAAAARRQQAAMAAARRRSPSPPMRRWRTGWALGMALVLCLVAGAAWQVQRHTVQYQVALQTGPREARGLDLPDGTRIELNRATELAVRFYPGRREVVLTRGEAFFQVASDAGKPFTVAAGDTVVTVVGTAFNVSTLPGHVQVDVQEGRVRVDAGRAPRRELTRNEFLRVGAAGAAEWGRTSADAVGSWRRGRLVFRDRPLAEVVQVLSRYRELPVRLADAQLGGRAVSGVVNTQSPDEFLRSLPLLLPVRVAAQPDGSLLISAAP